MLILHRKCQGEMLTGVFFLFRDLSGPQGDYFGMHEPFPGSDRYTFPDPIGGDIGNYYPDNGKTIVEENSHGR